MRDSEIKISRRLFLDLHVFFTLRIGTDEDSNTITLDGVTIAEIRKIQEALDAKLQSMASRQVYGERIKSGHD